MRVTDYGRVGKVEIAADGDGLVSRSGTALVAELAERLGLTAALSDALADTRERSGGHDPGRVLRDLAICLVDGGDCVSDLGALRDQPDLFGRVASNATAWRAIERACGRLDELRRARAKARERGRPERRRRRSCSTSTLTSSPPTPTKRAPPRPGRAGMASIRSPAISMRPRRHSPASCARVARAQTTRPTTSRCSASRSSRSPQSTSPSDARPL